MPVNAVNNPTITDVLSYLPKNSGPFMMIEALNFASQFWDDITFIEANNGTHHDASVRTGLPSGTWRALYEGVDPSRSSHVNVSDKSGQLTDYSVVDKTLYDQMGDKRMSWRASEDAAFYEGMMQNVLKTVFYGDVADSARAFTGLSNRFNTVNANTPTSENVIDAGGTGSTNASIWLVGWSPRTVALFYPKGKSGGLVTDNRGQQTVKDKNGRSYEAMVTYFEINVGLSVQDWTSVVRIANIDVTLLRADRTTGADLPSLMDQAADLISDIDSSARPVWYMTRRVRSMLRSQVENKSGYTMKTEDFYNNNRKVLTYAGFPIRALKTLLNTEVRVV